MMKIFHKNVWSAILLAAAAANFVSAADARTQAAAQEAARTGQVDVVKAYLRATQAHDSKAAYGHISAIDKGVRDEKTYIRSLESFSGFALALARRLAADLEVWLIDEKISSKRTRLEVGYRVPTGDEIAPQLFEWNPDKLNSLSPNARTALFANWENVKKTGNVTAIEGREAFDLVREKDGWKIFLDWQSQHRVVFKSSMRQPKELTIKFLRNDLFVRNDQPFQVDFTVTNQSNRDIVARLDHIFEPRKIEDYIEMIACGSLGPFRLRPRESREISSSYLLRGIVPDKAPIAIIYDFKLARRAGSGSLR